MRTTEFILHENKKKRQAFIGDFTRACTTKNKNKKIRAGESKLGFD